MWGERWWEMVGGWSVCGCLGGERGYKWCVRNLGGMGCVGGRLKGIQKFIIMLIQVIRNNNNGITITITSPLGQGTNNQLGVT